MSLVEAAVEKAKKKLAKTGIHKVLSPHSGPETPPRRQRRPEANAGIVAERAAQARRLPVASVDPEAMERAGVLLQVNDAAAQRSYRILRTRLQQGMQSRGWYSVAVTAAASGEGKTLTAINLAISLAMDINTWVYLVDLDLQRPKVADYFGMKLDKGISDYLAGQAQFDEILYNPGVERLTVVPNTQPMEYSSDLLDSPQIRALCQSLAAEVPRPIVIFDTPPLLLSDDMLKFYPNVDCALFVVSEGLTSRSSLQRAHEILADMELLGTVLNRSAEREEGGYY